MIFVGNKNNLDYYSGKPAELCYCDYVVSASDMYLQGSWNPNEAPYTCSVEVWSVSGNDIYEVVDASKYSIYYFVNPFTGRHTFTLRMKAYADSMCANKCFIMRVGVFNASNALVFAAFTERYCIASCCEAIPLIQVRSDGSVDFINVPMEGATTPISECGQPLIRMVTTSDCWNVWTQEYYGQPSTILNGTYLPYVSITAFKGKVQQSERSISREYSYNCKPQRIESSRQYNIIGNEIFPEWKMDELSSNLSSTNIYIDDFKTVRKFEYYGGTPFEKRDVVECWNVFRMTLTLSECIQRQIFGCATDCIASDNSAFFIIPSGYVDGNLFYDVNGNFIGDSIDLLLQWFLSNGMTATIVGLSPEPCNYFAIIQVTGGVIPQSIFYYPMSFATQIDALYVNIDDICDYIPTYCLPPVIGTITEGDIPCDTPSIGTITEGDVSGDTLTIEDQSPWVYAGEVGEFDATLYGNTVMMNIKLKRPVSGMIGDTYNAVNELVAIVYGVGVPTVNRILDENNSNMPTGQYLLIDTLGRIYFSGDIILTEDNFAEINLDNLVYNIV